MLSSRDIGSPKQLLSSNVVIRRTPVLREPAVHYAHLLLHPGDLVDDGTGDGLKEDQDANHPASEWTVWSDLLQ